MRNPLCPHSTTALHWIGAAALMHAAAAQALDCKLLEQQIEGKLHAAGVAGFRLETLDAAASATGREVGRCDHGTKKIMQRATAAAAAPRPASVATASGARTSRPAVITECRDGSTPTDGRCRR
ncbi:MAG: DUF1161 domain-containing protein [Comamonadaceae bacterium]|nr:DUF1161 domain-containing protein [Rubrivivax sp.]NLZ40357.1 DUF1161 domain-containing protein [Comamonadaceae bacterium]